MGILICVQHNGWDGGVILIRWDLEHEIWGGGRELEPQKPRVPVTYMEKSTKTDGVKYNA